MPCPPRARRAGRSASVDPRPPSTAAAGPVAPPALALSSPANVAFFVYHQNKSPHGVRCPGLERRSGAGVDTARCGSPPSPPPSPTPSPCCCSRGMTKPSLCWLVRGMRIMMRCRAVCRRLGPQRGCARRRISRRARARRHPGLHDPVQPGRRASSNSISSQHRHTDWF